MGLFLKILLSWYLCAGVRGVHQLEWLPCLFMDERVSTRFADQPEYRNTNTELIETELVHREAVLQFGQKGDAPVYPHAITFLLTGSKLDLRRYVEGAEVDQLECELRRYSTEGIYVRWPVQGARDYNRWYRCTIRHSEGLFTVTGFLRQSSDQPPPGQQDYRRWPTIEDRETLTTTVAMVIKTQTPIVKATLSSQQKLDCQFGLDHRGPNVTVEWHLQRRGERTKLFSHASRTGQTQGSGVKLKGLTGGDASYTLPFTKMNNEGSYICSVSVNPLMGSVDMHLLIQEPPRVSLNMAPTVSLQEGEEQKVVCEAERYYPLDVQIDWYEQDPASAGQRVGAPLPKMLDNVLLSSHKHNQDKTYSVSAFFYLRASLRDSGRQFTCRVSHASLRVPIKKSFILNVQEPGSWMFNLLVGFTIVSLMVVLYVMLRYLHSAKKRYVQKKPY